MQKKVNDNPSLQEVFQEKDENKKKEKYNAYVENMTPKSNGFLNCLKEKERRFKSRVMIKESIK